MKKLIAMLLAIAMVASMSIPAYAHDGNTASRSTTSWWNWWSDFIPAFPTTPTEPTEPEIPESELEAPVITEARFYHSASVASLKNRLQISWDAVENAESYEIEVTKADGTVELYTAASTSLMKKNAECPKVYIEETCTWTAATVRIRAIACDSIGDWSEAVKIGCDKLH